MTSIHTPSFRYFLMLTTALCGGLVMVVEVLGARVIGPFFGASLFVWTALITVTLLSLSVGYALGGHLADRHPSPDWLYGIILVSGLLVMLVPVLKSLVIQATAPMGLRMGALLSATILFGPALLLLGCVSPYVVRIATRELGQLGRTVGVLYALSTIGSMLGTALAGYLIIAYIGVSRAFQLCGVLLILLGVTYFLVFRRKAAAAVGLLIVAAAGWPPDRQLPGAVLPDGTLAQLLASKDSFYGSVKVVDYTGTNGGIRELLLNGLIQGGVDRATGQSVYEYAYLLDRLPTVVKPDTRSALILGLGAGVIAMRMQERGIEVDAVDIDPTVVEMAEAYFGLKMNRPVAIEDARLFLAQEGRGYDVVVMDAFTGDSTPSHLLSREALVRVKQRLADDGVVAINVMGSARRDSELLPAVVRTLQTQFSQVAEFPLFDRGDVAAKGGNVVLLAANRPLQAALNAHIDGVHPLAETVLRRGMRQARLLPPMPPGVVLEDDFNPLDVLDIEMYEQVRKAILESTPAPILLHG